MSVLALWGLVAGVLPARGSTPLVVNQLPEDSRLSVMTYNVAGLPWPVRFGRGAALASIGERLRALRTTGHQPHIVLLQEAFSDDARQIGAIAGYRYIAEGPTSGTQGADPASGEDRAFAAAASRLKGEGDGKLVGSGLRVLSDYPIVGLRRLAFPAFACAGYDCLANKGAVLALIAVPGVREPVAVVDTHLNSKRASRAGGARTLYAFERQVDALSAFLKANHRPESPLIVAGDFNVGKDGARIAYLQKAAAGWWNGVSIPGIDDALRSCVSESARCAPSLSGDARLSLLRRKDFQILGSGERLGLTVAQVATPFGHESDGTMLSDHIGYTVYYRLNRRDDAPRRS